MSVSLYQQKHDFTLETSQRTVLPPNKSISSNESNKLVPKVQHEAFQVGQYTRLSTVNNLRHFEPKPIRTLSSEKLSSSENFDHRRILPKASLDSSKSQSHRRVLLPQGKAKSGPSKTSEPTVQQSHFSLSANEQTMTRQACEEELEFLKLKLRYMQNDIEFKKNQIDSAKTSQPKESTIPYKWNRNSLQHSVRANSGRDTHLTSSLNFYPIPDGEIHPRTSATKWSAQVAGQQKIKTKANIPTKYSSVQERNILSQVVTKGSTFPVCTKSKNASTLYSWTSHLKSGTNLRPTSSFAKVKAVCEDAQYAPVSSASISNSNCAPTQQKYFGKDQTGATAFPSFSCSTDTNVVSYESETEIPLSDISTTKIAISAFDRLGNQRIAEASKAVSVSPDKRLVVLSLKAVPSAMVPLDSVQTMCQTVSSPAFAESSLNSDLNLNNSHVHVASFNEGITCFPLSATQIHPHDIRHSGKSSAISISRYKLVKNSSSSLAGLRKAQTTSRNSTTASVSSCNDFNIHSGVSPFSLPMKTAAVVKGLQANRLSLRSPNLKIQTAAKLVSKYKLKRLSPTSASSAAPLLFYDKAHCSKSLIYDQVDSQYSKDQHKLDRRPTTAKSSYNKFKADSYSSRINVLTKKHKIYSHPTIHQRNNVILKKLDFQGAKNMHKLDRRNFKIDKLKATARQAVVEKRGKRSRICDQFNTFMTSKASPRSKYSWRTTGMLQSKSALLSTSHNSRFRWSRPSLQTQNGTWQQLRQKLQLMLIKKHRYSRLKLSKYTSVAATSSIYNETLPVGGYKTNLVTIDGILYKSSRRKLTRTRRSSSFSFVKKTTAAPRITSASASSIANSSASVNSRKSSASHTDMKVVKYANRAIHRSIAITAAKYRKNNQKSKGKAPYCVYFGRFGKCNRGDKCPYIHDPEKVAVCTRFLRGKCDAKDCPFSHKASKNKIPVCLYYLKGSCSRENCPYLHVRVNPNAPVCKDFRNGFCALGEKCKNIHSHVCPSFAMTGTCSRLGTCTMLHRTSKREQDGFLPLTETARRHQSVNLRRNVPHLSSESHPAMSDKSVFTPVCTTTLAAQPSFISLQTSPSFISLEKSHQEKDYEKDRKDLNQGKPGFVLGKVGDTVLRSAQDISTGDGVPSIRPSFLASKLVVNKTVEGSFPQQ